MNKELVKSNVQEVLTEVLSMFDKSKIDNFQNFEEVIRDIANVTVELYYNKYYVLSSFSGILDEYKKNVDNIIKEAKERSNNE